MVVFSATVSILSLIHICFRDIAAHYRMVAEVEKQHNIIFNYLYEAVKNGTLYKNDSPILWVCSECGYMHVATEAWKKMCIRDSAYPWR